MKRKIFSVLFSAVLTVAIGYYYFALKSDNSTDFAKEIIVYKSSTCLCCNDWVDHMEENGFKVVAHDVPDVDQYKDQYAVPINARSCHTGIVDGYFIEGHVPAQDVKRLLLEKKNIAGLAVPEMPIGTPGMEMGGQKDPYDVIAYSQDGSQTIYASYQ